MLFRSYIVTVPASAAVCAFELRTADDRVVVGLVKEKTQATREFEDAYREGRFAGLVDWVSDDSEYAIYILFLIIM